jgi:hypothetical protein
MAKATSNKTTTKATANGKPAKKATAAKAPVTERAPRPKKEGLRKAQVRILEALKKGPHTRTEIIENAKVDPAWVYIFVGQDDKERNDHNESKWGVKSLAAYSPSLVKFKTREIEDGVTENIVEITPAGKQALEKHLKAESAKSA